MEVFIAALSGAILNRLSGMDRWFPGRNIYGVAIILLVVGWLFLSPLWGLGLFLSALAYRLPGWFDAIDIGRNEGTFAKDTGIMFVRGLFFFPAFLLTGAWWMVFVAAALQTLSYLIAAWVLWGRSKDPYLYAELGAGASFGLCLALAVG